MGMFTERRLRRISRELVAAREDLRITDEQALHFTEIADDTRIRSIVSDSPQDRVDHDEAEQTSTSMARHRADLVVRIQKLEHEQ
ncbi:MAG TPA: hypothetical protein VL068_01010, partial [Microthrixaceae bacterium]|nr:hypothetical protein [Microthrixaceae bacterium]